MTVAATMHVTLSLTVPGATPFVLLAAAGAAGALGAALGVAALVRRRRAPHHAHLPTP